MAYTDYSFYTGVFYGDTLTEDNANKWLERASDELDTLTFRRLSSAFPTNDADAIRVKKAVCAIAEALCLIDVQQKAVSAQLAADGNYRGAITSISSGDESISYSVNGAASTSAYAAAAASAAAQTSLISSIAAKYLALVPDANGINLLYAGVIENGEAGNG